jgi:tRNA A-37 threonylcarbamoyl transferase component Bud32
MTIAIRELAPEWATPSVRAWCEKLEQELLHVGDSAVIYRGRNTLTRLTVNEQHVVVKAFPAPRTLLKRIQRWGRASKAVRAFRHAERMITLGIGTPEPIAALESSDGRAWYVCRFADGYVTAGALFKQQTPETNNGTADDGGALVTALGNFLARMHAAGVYHFDATPGNFLLRAEDLSASILVVDCNRMRFGRVSLWAGVRSLAQLRHDVRLVDSYSSTRGWSHSSVMRCYRMRLWLHDFSWWWKNMTRPWRRKFGL